MRTGWRKYALRPLEAALVGLGYGCFSILPLDAASGLGGWLAHTIGPRLKRSNVARRNLKRVFPEKPDSEIEEIVHGVWDNMGRVVGEFPRLDRLSPDLEKSRVEVIGGEYVDLLKNDGKPGIVFSGHIANWEIICLAMSKQGLEVHQIYRSANNPLLEWALRRGRSAIEGGKFPKGASGAKEAIAALRQGEHLGMVVDQKMNDGISVPFLGIEAMTAPGIAQFALKFDCPLVPARVERLNGARFRLTFYPPLEMPNTGNRNDDVEAIMGMVNDLIGEWIFQRPEQWLWLHNRWPEPS
ncbi:MAG: lauroyl acyltransferase [Rhodospirillales bacterium]